MINRTTQNTNNEVPRRIVAAERAIRDFKTKQGIGIDSLGFVATSQALWSPGLLASGAYRSLSISFTGSAKLLYASELGISRFINNDLDLTYRWPDGSNLTTDLFAIRWHIDYDISISDITGSGSKTYVVTAENFGTAAKTPYVRLQLLLPKGAVG